MPPAGEAEQAAAAAAAMGAGREGTKLRGGMKNVGGAGAADLTEFAVVIW